MRHKAPACANADVLVVGCGGLGGMFAHVLFRRAKVFCFDPDRDMARHVNACGLSVIDGGVKLRTPLTIVTDRAALKGRFFDAIVFAVKCPDVGRAVADVLGRCRTHRAYFFQNGAMPLERIGRVFPQVRVVRGVTTAAVRADRRGGVNVISRGDAYLGGGRDGRWLARVLARPGYGVHVLKDVAGAVWAKLIFNAVMNPLPVVVGQGYGILHEDPQVCRMVVRAVKEGKAVARAYGIRLAFDPLRIVAALAGGRHAALTHKGSMHDDLCRGRVTEIEFITGELLRRGKKAGVPMPVLSAIYVAARKKGVRGG